MFLYRFRDTRRRDTGCEWVRNNRIGNLLRYQQFFIKINTKYVYVKECVKSIKTDIYPSASVLDLLITWSQKWVPINHKNHQNYVKISFQRSKPEVKCIKDYDRLPFSMVFIGFYPTIIIISKLQNPYWMQTISIISRQFSWVHSFINPSINLSLGRGNVFPILISLSHYPYLFPIG